MDENVIYLDTNKTISIDVIMNEASEEIGNCLIKYAEKGLPIEALIGLLEIYKHNMTVEHVNIEDI